MSESALSLAAEALGRVPLFHALAPDQLLRLAAATTRRTFPQGMTIVRQGDEGRSLYLLESGLVRVLRDTTEGDTIELGKLRAGEFFDEMALLDGRPRSSTVVAAEDCACLLLPRWALIDGIRADPMIALRLLAVLSLRLREVEQRLTS